MDAPVHESAPCAPIVTTAERSFRSVDPDAWDAFVRSSGGSFLGSWLVVRANHLLQRVRLFECFVTSSHGCPLKVAQCAVAVSHGRFRFLDRLHLSPAHQELWEPCMHLVMQHCGPGAYEYGSTWNHEEPRPTLVVPESMVPVEVAHVRFQVDRIDFADWADFASYRRAVSENIRRDYKKAAAASAQVVVRHGPAAFRDLWAFARLRQAVMDRNDEQFSWLSDVVRHALKLVFMGRFAFMARVEAEGRCQAVFFGVRFGADVYYIGGGTGKNSQGYGSFLFLTLIEQWFKEHPRGKLYLGRQSACVDPSTYTRGNQLYRRKLRATTGSGVQFSLKVATSPGRYPQPEQSPGSRVAAPG